jgi:hypothetical protein
MAAFGVFGVLLGALGGRLGFWNSIGAIGGGNNGRNEIKSEKDRKVGMGKEFAGKNSCRVGTFWTVGAFQLG